MDDKNLFYIARCCIGDGALAEVVKGNFIPEYKTAVINAWNKIENDYNGDFSICNVLDFFFKVHNKNLMNILNKIEVTNAREELKTLLMTLIKQDHSDLNHEFKDSSDPKRFYEVFKNRFLEHLVIPYKISEIKNSEYRCSVIRGFYVLPEALTNISITQEELDKSHSLIEPINPNPRINDIILLHGGKIVYTPSLAQMKKFI